MLDPKISYFLGSAPHFQDILGVAFLMHDTSYRDQRNQPAPLPVDKVGGQSRWTTGDKHQRLASTVLPQQTLRSKITSQIRRKVRVLSLPIRKILLRNLKYILVFVISEIPA
jgi:hypothetical protein